ncbi:MAG: precorrin-2 C(20)-methyltransferase [Firmicutes bacterium]|nr:precorrin-2 C(20)-methyltransferase [Bacillota bacterium]
MKGKLYGVGVGCGDPELMTLKAVRIIKENDIIAAAGKEPEKSAAYKIAVQVIPELSEKKITAINMPMTKDRNVIGQAHKEGAKTIEKYLESGKNVVYITLGDPTVYSTFSYIEKIVSSDGYETEYVSGITSFCMAAAKFCVPLCEWDEEVCIMPSVHSANDIDFKNRNYVLMKCGKKLKDIKEIFCDKGYELYMAENCGMSGEKIYRGIEEIPDETGYFSTIIAKNTEE